MARNVRLYRWFRFANYLLFWQGVWFLFFQERLSTAEAVLLYATYDISVTLFEVPSGYFSDRIGRRVTLVLSGVASFIGALLLVMGDSFAAFALANLFLGLGVACVSGTDSALLYESLAADGRADEIEREEMIGWRFGFTGLMVSALVGGALMLWWDQSVYIAAAAAFAAVTALALCMTEPPRQREKAAERAGARLRRLGAAFRQPELRWLFALAVLMYGLSNLPFVFGQPLLLAAFTGLGHASETPFISGAVTAAMMAVSLVASLFVPALRARVGVMRLLLVAMAMQIALIAAMVRIETGWIVVVLLLRMVPDAFSGPFLRARVQPLLSDGVRASFFSAQSLVAKLLFAGSLVVVAGGAAAAGAMSRAEIGAILLGYLAAGLLGLVLLAITARRDF